MIRLLPGDCRDVLPTLEANSVHCVVCSPPYYALRSYLDASHPDKHREIGSEPTPNEYLQTMVAVFREIKRVLRDDGVCFVNLGDSYASGALRTSQFQADAPACDSDGIGPEGSPELGSVCPDLCGECRGSLLSHSVHRIDLLEAVLRRENADGHQPCDVPRVSPMSTMRQSSPLQPAQHSQASIQGAGCLLCGRSLTDDALASVRKGECSSDNGSSALASRSQGTDASGLASTSHTTASHRYKPKDLLMMPARLALALQADGWWLRSDIIWAKPNPMPESCRDRPTSAHEHVFLLSKRSRYFYDADAVREEAEYGRRDTAGAWRGGAYVNQKPGQDNSVGTGLANSVTGRHPETGRNLRNVWTIATAPLSSAFVGGRYRIASQDCAVHDRQADLARVLECDARQDVFRFGRNPGKRSRPAELPEGAVVSIPVDRCEFPSDVSSAIGHSSAIHRTPALSERDVIFGDISGGHTGCRVFLDHCFATSARTPASNIEGGCAQDGLHSYPLGQKADRIVGIATYEPRPDGCSCYYAGTVHKRQDHFASYPPELVERCIRAGTSERGCCAQCGKPYQRTTTGWRAQCDHGGDPVPCVVLDCFAGAGTTLLVADRLQRNAIGIELNADYTTMAMERVKRDAPLFADLAPAQEPTPEPSPADLFSWMDAAQ